jgi:septal ring factor EnvC (AmiA/AmiB activator)
MRHRARTREPGQALAPHATVRTILLLLVVAMGSWLEVHAATVRQDEARLRQSESLTSRIAALEAKSAAADERERELAAELHASAEALRSTEGTVDSLSARSRALDGQVACIGNRPLFDECMGRAASVDPM